jgi:hypothetical protein
MLDLKCSADDDVFALWTPRSAIRNYKRKGSNIIICKGEQQITLVLQGIRISIGGWEDFFQLVSMPCFTLTRVDW